MAPTLYTLHESPPVRAVLITAKAIDLDLIEREVDFFGGEHLKPEYLKLNPQHTVPVLIDDDGFTFWDSHAILAYLVSKYAKDDSLYPKDLKKRAIIDQRLHFDSGTMFARLMQAMKPVLIGQKNTLYDVDIERMDEAYAFLEAFLKDHQWVAGDFISIADYSLIATVSSAHTLFPVDAQKYPNVTGWIRKLEERPEYEVNKKGLHLYEKLYKNKLSK